jgi:hypothetical protein
MNIYYPFNGIIDDIKCYGIDYEEGLHIQCGNEKYKNEYCLKCYKESKKNIDKKPNVGDIRDRLLVLNKFDYVDRYNRRTISWYDYLKNKGIDYKFALEKAKEDNVIINDYQGIAGLNGVYYYDIYYNTNSSISYVTEDSYINDEIPLGQPVSDTETDIDSNIDDEDDYDDEFNNNYINYQEDTYNVNDISDSSYSIDSTDSYKTTKQTDYDTYSDTYSDSDISITNSHYETYSYKEIPLGQPDSDTDSYYNIK